MVGPDKLEKKIKVQLWTLDSPFDNVNDIESIIHITFK